MDVLAKQPRQDVLSTLAVQIRGSILAIEESVDLINSDDPLERQHAMEEMEMFLQGVANDREELLKRADELLTFRAALRERARYRKSESDRIRTMVKSDTDKADRIETTVIRMLRLALEDQGATKFDLPMHEIRSRMTTQVVIDDYECAMETLPEDCRKVEIKPDKAGIKKALQDGRQIPGCRLHTDRAWRSN